MGWIGNILGFYFGDFPFFSGIFPFFFFSRNVGNFWAGFGQFGDFIFRIFPFSLEFPAFPPFCHQIFQFPEIQNNSQNSRNSRNFFMPSVSFLKPFSYKIRPGKIGKNLENGYFWSRKNGKFDGFRLGILGIVGNFGNFRPQVDPPRRIWCPVTSSCCGAAAWWTRPC